MEVTVDRPLATEIAGDNTAALKATVSELAFDVEKVADLFEKAVVADHDSDVTLPLFVAAYEELNKFIGMLGRIFQFVQADVRSKTTRLRELNKKEPQKYDSVETLFAHEVTSKNFEGAKSLLALHRALQFIVDFMEALAGANNDSSVAEICQLSYGRTLAKHHGWAIRKAVSLAAYTLPSRKNLILCVVEEPPSEEFVKKAILRVVESGKSVFERVSIYYEKHGLHQLI